MHTGRYIQGEAYWLSKVRPMSMIVQMFGVACFMVASAWHPPGINISIPITIAVVISVLCGACSTLSATNFYRVEWGGCLSVLALSLGFNELVAASSQGLFISLVIAVIITLVVTCLFHRSEIFLTVVTAVWLIFFAARAAELSEHPLLRFLVLIWAATCILSISGHCVFRYLRATNLSISSTMHELAFKDELTGIDNRRCVLAKAADLIDSAAVDCCFMMIDIDDFKSINDRFGHEEGDVVLRQVGQALKAQANTMPCGRIGGEEFCIVYQGTAVHHFADSLRAAIAQFSNERYRVTVSIGGVRMVHAGSVSGLMRMADTALYRVKAQGKNNFALFVPSVHECEQTGC